MPPKTAKNEVQQAVDRSERRTVTGVVTADKMDKTVKVRVERLVQHPQFSKTLRKHYDCYAHDEKREAKLGDKVELMESRPLSKLKHWRLVRVVEKAIAGSMVEDARHAARPSVKSAAAVPASKPAPKTT
ncbi:MAG TPA: 30S ribosomal protein S17 [Planctomycetota bacterium]|nr:30S ribosomal protein S17 [Planctomycetota bacterium]